MAKVLLVEDDNNLREIYQARLLAEGYDIVTASDGEEALDVAKKEVPELVISDVMMPKLSGFEMLDIMRKTESLQSVKVIMLTALGQAEDQTKADQLGADRYLVKSQVTLEDIINSAKDLLEGGSSATVTEPEATAATEAQPSPEPATPQPVTTEAQVSPSPQADIPVADAPAEPEPEQPAAPQMPPTPASTPPTDGLPTQADQQASVEQQIANFIDNQPASPPPQAPAPQDDSVPPSPSTTVQPNANDQQQVLNDAVTSLSGTDAQTDQPTPQASEEPREPVVIAPSTNAVNADGTPKKSIQELAAEEEAKEQQGQNGVDPNSIAL